jgi:hypothetical protein
MLNVINLVTRINLKVITVNYQLLLFIITDNSNYYHEIYNIYHCLW